MTLMLRFLFLLFPLLMTNPSQSQPLKPELSAPEVVEAPAAIRQTIVDSLQRSRPELKFESVTRTPVDGIYAVKVINGPTLYTSADGRYFVLGDMFEVTSTEYVNIAEKAREASRAEKLAELSTGDMIVFTPQDQPAKASIMVFTDVDCFYCQKLHQEVPDLNRIGIEVRYLAFPRAGIGSESYRKIASAWCADDQQTALTKLKNRQSIPINVCPGNPVKQQYELGGSIGVTGTPALVTAEGHLMPGYMPALQLANALGVAVDPELAKELKAREAAQRR